jgi:dihydrofolate reductase
MYSLICAFDNNFGIGYNNKLPWQSLRDDMLHFKKVTANHLLLCGYNTYLSLDRNNILGMNRELLIMPRNINDYKTDEIQDYIQANNPKNKAVVVIGGYHIYDYFLRNNLIDKMYLTWVRSTFTCDTYFPYEHLLGIKLCDSSVYETGDCRELSFLDIFENKKYQQVLHEKKVSLIQTWENYIERVETRYFELYL